jgi:teichuronic acid biosynthesis glycosyltransferase TuaC
MRILVVTTTHHFPSDPRPTSGIFFGNFLKHLGDCVQRIVVVSPTAYIPEPLMRLRAFAFGRGIRPHQYWRGIEVFRPSYLAFRAKRRLWVAARNLARAAVPLCEELHRRHAFDLVLSSGVGMTTQAGACVARSLDRPCVGWAMGGDVHSAPFVSAENLRLLRHSVRRAALVLTTSDAIRRQLLRLCPRAGNVQTFYRGIDLAGLRDLRDRSELRRKHGLSRERTYVFSAGNCFPQKGVWEFYAAFRELAGARPDLAALWVGSGPEAARLRAKAAQDGLTDRFRVVGHVRREVVLELLQAVDILALPSYKEGLPNVVIEAMAAGLPTIATDVGGTAEIVRDGVTGLLIPPRDVRALAEAMARLTGDGETARRLAHNGRALALKYFDVARNARLCADIFRRLIAGALEWPLPAAADLPPGMTPVEAVRAAAAGAAG